MLYNYSLLKGTIAKDLEDHIKNSRTHYNLIVNADNLEYQVNIDVQSTITPNVKMLFIEEFSNKILISLNKLGEEGLFSLNDFTPDYRLDYLRSNIFPCEDLENIQPKSWQEISNILDQHIKVGRQIYCLGDYYNNQQIREHVPHGLMLQQSYPDYLPPQGIHDTHMNQGVPLTMPQSKSNGIYQDGAIFLKTDNNTMKAFFFVFTSQS
ncbi:DUF2278 family protein [Candidatus Tisiphia endosymbiont of Nemotelus uliginosus]|uniref:DUF2278 family protein n=1 Tax=Candidatus Tisiphia endosymbiont of Nemotelus uliginosus TaxID=3077926 RepID=UPI0035C937C7